jgi:D-alanine-D-alanine ligase
VEVASARYFGTPKPPEFNNGHPSSKENLFAFLTGQRDRLEKRLERWVKISSRSGDPIGVRHAASELNDLMQDMDMQPVTELTDSPHCWTWETKAGMADGTLLILHLDIPFNPVLGAEHFHRDPEWLYGEGIGVSRSPIVMLEFALRALRRAKRLHQRRIGVLIYGDEGRDAEESAQTIQKAAHLAAQILVLRPGNQEDALIIGRRGQRRYRAIFHGKPVKLGHSGRQPEVMLRALGALEDLAALNDRKARLAISAVDIRSEAYPRLLPHRIIATLQASFPNARQAEHLEQEIRRVLHGAGGEIALLSDRPAMPQRRINQGLLKRLRAVADQWQIPLSSETSLWPSVAGLIATDTPVICGIGPVARGLYTGQEAVSRISLVQRTLLLAAFLLGETL